MFGGLAAALLLAQLFLPRPRFSRLWDGIFDAGHAVVFGGIAWAVWVILCAYERPRRALFRGLAAFGVAAWFGFLTEAAQIPGPRNADLWDGLRDLAGAAGVLLLVAAGHRGRRLPRQVVITVAMGALLIGFWLGMRPLTVHVSRTLQLPSLARFDRPWGRSLVGLRDATITWQTRPGPTGTPVAAAEITYLAQGVYPAFMLHEPHPDWSGYTDLALDLFIPGDLPRTLLFRVVDRGIGSDYTEQFGRTLEFAPGWHQVRFPLESVSVAISGRRIHLDEIQSLVIFVPAPETPFRIVLANLRLER